MANQIKTKAKILDIDKFGTELFVLKLKADKRLPRFRPGQFLHLTNFHYDPSNEWPESRVFSIAKFNKQERIIELAISVKGAFTNNLFNTLQVENDVWLKLPYGDMDFEKTTNPIVLIAGGTGITPIISYINYCIQNEISRSIKLYYGVRNNNLFLYDTFLENAKELLPNFDYNVSMEELEIESNVKFTKGILSKERILNENIKINKDFYIFGPVQMVTSFVEHFKQNGVNADNIIIEKWD